MQVRIVALIASALALIGAAAAVPLERLSVQERLHGLPDSTLVSVRGKTLTLGSLRAAHGAREASASNVRSLGASSARSLHVGNPTTGGAGTATGRTNVVNPGLPHNGLFTPQPAQTQRPVKLPGFGGLTAYVFESPSQYAGAPADMKAFCKNALASACLYLPPQQPFLSFGDSSGSTLADVDPLLDQSQCGAEGGRWSSNGCLFLYPAGVLVRFTPGPTYQATTTAQCDGSWWVYTVDPRGTIKIGLSNDALHNLFGVGIWGYQGPPTGSTPWCVVEVKRS